MLVDRRQEEEVTRLDELTLVVVDRLPDDHLPVEVGELAAPELVLQPSLGGTVEVIIARHSPSVPCAQRDGRTRQDQPLRAVSH